MYGYSLIFNLPNKDYNLGTVALIYFMSSLSYWF